VVNDGKLVNRLRDGKGITLKTITRIRTTWTKILLKTSLKRAEKKKLIMIIN